MDFRTLYRPVGFEEYELIAASGFKRFPPRLSDQPIFYPVLVEDYAIQIARDWNTKNGATGFVTEFDVDRSFLAEFEEQTVGTRGLHVELWVPADVLPEFNEHIVGPIRVTHAYRGDPAQEIQVPALGALT